MDPIILHPNTYFAEQFQDSAYSILCEAKGAEQIAWYSPRDVYVSETRTKYVFAAFT